MCNIIWDILHTSNTYKILHTELGMTRWHGIWLHNICPAVMHYEGNINARLRDGKPSVAEIQRIGEQSENRTWHSEGAAIPSRGSIKYIYSYIFASEHVYISYEACRERIGISTDRPREQSHNVTVGHVNAALAASQ